MGNTTWTSSDNIVHKLPHHTFIEKHIRALRHVKYDSYFGEYFSCHHCLEKDKSWKGVVGALGETHKKLSLNCPNATCACGALQHNKHIRLRSEVFCSYTRLNSCIYKFLSQKINHRACTGRCSCVDCTALFNRLVSFRKFLYHVSDYFLSVYLKWR